MRDRAGSGTTRRFQRLRHRSPRWIAGAWFGAWGALIAGSMFLVPALSRGWEAVLLYVVAPGIAAMAGGAVIGRALLGGNVAGLLRAAGLGLVAAVLAHLFVGPLFGGLCWLLDGCAGSSGTGDPFGLTLAVTWVGFLATAVLTLPAGAVAGGLLSILWRRWVLVLVGALVATLVTPQPAPAQLTVDERHVDRAFQLIGEARFDIVRVAAASLAPVEELRALWHQQTAK